MDRSNKDAFRSLMLSSACVALNVALGKTSNVLALPITFDTVGTILAAALLPARYAFATGICTNLVATFVISPFFLPYTGTQIAIAGVAVLLNKVGSFKRIWTSVAAGLIIGIVSATVSSPVTALLFGGVAVPSITALNVLLLASGKNLWQSVITGALVVESLDKAIAGAIVWMVLRRLPDAVVRPSQEVVRDA